MPWYLEFNHYPFCDHRSQPERKDDKLDCPDDINCRDQAVAAAQMRLDQNGNLKNEQPELVWKEKISVSKSRRRDFNK